MNSSFIKFFKVKNGFSVLPNAYSATMKIIISCFPYIYQYDELNVLPYNTPHLVTRINAILSCCASFFNVLLNCLLKFYLGFSIIMYVTIHC